MRVLFFGNNWLGWRIAEHLVQEQGEIVGAVLHPPDRRKYSTEIERAVSLPADRIFDGSRMHDPEVVQAIAALRPQVGVSAFFGYILRPAILDLFPQGCVNLHTSLLPFNRGAHPNLWSIVDGTPAGVSLHYVDAGVDTGDVIAQRELVVEPVDTGATLYRKLELAALELFGEWWPAVRDGIAPRTPQLPGSGTLHRVRDAAAVFEIDLDRECTARDVIDRLRACTFPPYPGAFFMHEGRRVRMQLHLTYDDEREP